MPRISSQSKRLELLNGGPTRVEGAGTGMWRLTQAGLVAAGLVTEADQIDYLNWVFGTSVNNLLSLQAFASQLAQLDESGNGYVCTFELRGTRAWTGDRRIDFTAFSISDDRLRKD